MTTTWCSRRTTAAWSGGNAKWRAAWRQAVGSGGAAAGMTAAVATIHIGSRSSLVGENNGVGGSGRMRGLTRARASSGNDRQGVMVDVMEWR